MSCSHGHGGCGGCGGGGGCGSCDCCKPRRRRGATGPTGSTGATGPAGATGADGSPGGTAVGAPITFSGLISPESTILPLTSYLANAGIGTGGVGVYSEPLRYPVAQDRTILDLAVNLPGLLVGAPTPFVIPEGGEVTVDVITRVDGIGPEVVALSVTYVEGSPGIQTTTGFVALPAGDTFDVRVSTTGFESATSLEVTATVGIV